MIKLICDLDGGAKCTAASSTSISSNASFNLMLFAHLTSSNQGWNAGQQTKQQAMKTLTFVQSFCIFAHQAARTKVSTETCIFEYIYMCISSIILPKILFASMVLDYLKQITTYSFYSSKNTHKVHFSIVGLLLPRCCPIVPRLLPILRLFPF